MAKVGRTRRRTRFVEVSAANGEPPGGRQQKMSRPAGWIDYAQIEQCVDRGLAFFTLGAFGDQWIERLVEQHLHQAIGRVVACGRLAFVSGRLDKIKA